MPELKDILYKVPLTSGVGDMAIEVSSICFDSRKAAKGALFVAVKGSTSDGHDFIERALDLGADAVLCERLPASFRDGVTYVAVKNSAVALGIVASNFFGNPSASMKIVGVTGTNGKTTVATLLFKLFGSLGVRRGLLSTVENKIEDEVIPATHTTPDRSGIDGCNHQG